MLNIKPTLPNLIWLFVALTLSVGSMAQTRVYRCIDSGGTTVFSDQPCNEQFQQHVAGPRLSVIEVPDNVEAVAEANRAFIQQQRERREAAARQRAQREATPPPPAPRPVQSRVQFVPYWLPPIQQKPEPPPRVEREREERFSALSGRQLGSTRRRDQ